jgi:hypothetical protein
MPDDASKSFDSSTSAFAGSQAAQHKVNSPSAAWAFPPAVRPAANATAPTTDANDFRIFSSLNLFGGFVRPKHRPVRLRLFCPARWAGFPLFHFAGTVPPAFPGLARNSGLRLPSRHRFRRPNPMFSELGLVNDFTKQFQSQYVFFIGVNR